MSRNQTVNSQDDIFRIRMYPKDYNVRKHKHADAVTGEKLKEFNRLEKLRNE